MFRFELPNGQVLIVEASNKGEAIRRAQQWIAANISADAASDPGINASLDRTGRIARPTEIQAGDTFVRRGSTGETLPSDPLDNSTTGSGVIPGEPFQGTGGAAGGGGQQAGGTSQPAGDIRQSTGEDIQNFPFASFANALSQRGLDTEGVLGSSISQAFNPLAAAGRIGSFTGTVPSIGNDPGALESFFGNRLGGGGALAQQVFSDLRSGRAAPGLGAEDTLEGFDNLTLSGLRAPDIGTSEGRGLANEVLNLAQAAARNRFGGFAASLLPSNTRAIDRFKRPLAQGQQEDFLEFAARTFGV